MQAYGLAVQNFSIAEQLLRLYELFRDLRQETPPEELRLAVCRLLKLPDNAHLQHACNEQAVVVATAQPPIPDMLLMPDGGNFLLRQAVVVACTALESFFWDALRENVLTIVRARGRRADSSLRKLTLTIDDYLSIEGYEDPDVRLQQIILKNFERGTLYDAVNIEHIAAILNVKDYWSQVSERCGLPNSDIKRQLNELIARRNLIAHRADRPDEKADPPEETDRLGLREISYSWTNARVAIAKTVVSASSEIFNSTLSQLRLQLEGEEEQKLAQATLRKPTAP